MTEDERVRIGYPAALQLIAYEGQVIWRTFSAMVAANSFLLALGGFAAKEFHNVTALRAMPFLGWALCACWFLVLRRQFGFYGYWFAWARYIESFLDPPVRITQEGRERFSRGETAKVDPLDPKGTGPRLSGLARILRVEHLMWAVITVFAYLYYLLYEAI